MVHRFGSFVDMRPMLNALVGRLLCRMPANLVGTVNIVDVRHDILEQRTGTRSFREDRPMLPSLYKHHRKQAVGLSTGSDTPA